MSWAPLKNPFMQEAGVHNTDNSSNCDRHCTLSQCHSMRIHSDKEYRSGRNAHINELPMKTHNNPAVCSSPVQHNQSKKPNNRYRNQDVLRFNPIFSSHVSTRITEAFSAALDK